MTNTLKNLISIESPIFLLDGLRSTCEGKVSARPEVLTEVTAEISSSGFGLESRSY